MRKLTILLAVFVLAGAITVATGTSAKNAKKQLNVVLLVGGRINDGGFSQTMYEGLRQVAKQDGAVKLTYRELLAQGGQTAYDNAVRQAASDPKIDLVVAHGIDLVASVDRFALQFPNAHIVTSFFLPSGKIHPNVGLYISNFEEVGYAAGFLLAKTTKTGHVGYIGGPEFPFLHMELWGVQQALKKYLPAKLKKKLKLEVIFTGDWEDVQKGKEAALTMQEKGVDVVYNILAGGASGVFSTCVQKKFWCIGNSFFATPLGPSRIPSSAVHGAYGLVIKPWLSALRAGTWNKKFGGKIVPLTLQNGVTTVTPATAAGRRAFPALQGQITKFLRDARAGRIHVKPCPLKACKG
jgi:basic membrane protein A